MKTKKLPERFCLGCQQSLPKKSLVRIVRSPEGEFSVDFGDGTVHISKIIHGIRKFMLQIHNLLGAFLKFVV